MSEEKGPPIDATAMPLAITDLDGLSALYNDARAKLNKDPEAFILRDDQWRRIRATVSGGIVQDDVEFQRVDAMGRTTMQEIATLYGVPIRVKAVADDRTPRERQLEWTLGARDRQVQALRKQRIMAGVDLGRLIPTKVYEDDMEGVEIDWSNFPDEPPTALFDMNTMAFVGGRRTGRSAIARMAEAMEKVNGASMSAVAAHVALGRSIGALKDKIGVIKTPLA